MASAFEPGDMRFEFEHDGNYKHGIETSDGNSKGKVPQISNRESKFQAYTGDTFRIHLVLKGLPAKLKVVNEVTGEVIIKERLIEMGNKVILKVPLERKHIGLHRTLVSAENHVGKVYYEFELFVLEGTKQDQNIFCTLL